MPGPRVYGGHSGGGSAAGGTYPAPARKWKPHRQPSHSRPSSGVAAPPSPKGEGRGSPRRQKHSNTQSPSRVRPGRALWFQEAYSRSSVSIKCTGSMMRRPSALGAAVSSRVCSISSFVRAGPGRRDFSGRPAYRSHWAGRFCRRQGCPAG